jgi:DNA polymerase-3 subunit alpha
MTLFELMGDDHAKRFDQPPEVKVRTPKLQLLIKEKELLGFFLTGHPMDAYRDVLMRLSCVPLHEIEKMDHDTIFRVALLVESVETRISAKNGRKFAITMISDGPDRYELPIWADQYEEKGHLLKENQLLYAVLQIDRREDIPKLSSRWFDDLTQVTEATIEACDKAYDKAKMMLTKVYPRNSHGSKTTSKGDATKGKRMEETPKKEPSRKERWLVKLDAEKVRLSHILKIKEIIRGSRGNTPLDFDFSVRGSSLGRVAIEANWGVDGSKELKERLQQLPIIFEIETSR